MGNSVYNDHIDNANGAITMTTQKDLPTKAEMKARLTLAGWFTKPNSDHMYKELNGKLYRVKFQARTFRKEVQVNYTDQGSMYGNQKGWVRLSTYKMKGEK